MFFRFIEIDCILAYKTFDPTQKLANNRSGQKSYVAGEKGDRGGE